MAPAPRATRPFMPGYGVDAASGAPLPWSWAAERLAAAHNYWVATVRPDGAPHAMPVWGVWLDDAFWFSTGERSRKARNLAAEARCVVSTERADEAVIVEGTAERVDDPAALRRFAQAYDPKYGWEIGSNPSPVFRVRPRVVFGFVEAADDFAAAATRWSFET